MYVRLPSIRNAKKGFTLIELLVVAPIAIITIATLISLMVALVGDVAVSRERSVSSYDVQDALDRIEQDARIATTYMPTFSLFTTPQGEDDATAAFTSASGDLIISQYATTSDPYDTNRKIAYYADQPYACTSTYTLNRPMTNRVIYFTKVSGGVTSLWRRVIVPNGSTSDTGTTKLCDNPWQRNSCSDAFATTSPCKTRDEKMLDYVSSFAITYYSQTGVVTTDVRNSASIKVSLTQTKSISGESIATNGVARASHVNITTDDIPTAPNISVYNPSVNTYNNPILTTFEWDAIKNAAVYSVRYDINGGSTVTAPDQTGTRFQITNARPRDVINIRVASKNDMGTSSETLYTYTTPLWTVANLEGSWDCYEPAEVSFPCPGYTLTDSGMVVTRGLAVGGTTAQVIFTLPAGLWPIRQQIFPISASNTFGRVDALTDGKIIYNFPASPTFVSLDSIRFIAVGTPGITWNAATITTANGWSNYGGSFGVPSYTKDASGRVIVVGLLQGTSAVVTFGASMLSFLSGYQPPASAIYPGIAASVFYPYQVASTLNIQQRGMGAANSWNSIGSIYYPSGTSVAQNLLTPTGSWVNYSTGFNSLGYAKGSDGVVTLRGLIKLGTTTQYTTIGTLPAGYRPGKRVIAIGSGINTTNSTTGQIPIRFDVLPSGVISLVSYPADNMGNGYLSLEGIHFYQEN